MRIGVDIDGVIADTFVLLVRELNNYFQADLALQDINDYNIFKVYGLSDADMFKFLREKEEALMEGPALKDGAAQCLSMLAQKHAIFLVSARNEKYRPQTEKWLRKHAIPYHGLILLGSHDKREACSRISVDLFIEDSLKNAHQISSCGVPVLLLDAPYNQGQLPPLVRRCSSWEEIFEVIERGDLGGIGNGCKK